MHIFILEDDIVQQTKMEEIVTQIVLQHRIDCKKVTVFGKAEQLLDAVEKRNAHQLFFLDIEMKTEEKKGLEIAQKIRDIAPLSIIVFVTTHSEWMPLTFQYQISALDYIDKSLPLSVFKQRVEEAIRYAAAKNHKTVADDSFYFKSRYAQVQVPFSEILYFETSSHAHRVILHTNHDRIEFTASLSDIVKKEKRLVQCHRSFVVNPFNVIKVDRQKKILYFSNGASCFIARHKLSLVVEALENLHQ